MTLALIDWVGVGGTYTSILVLTLILVYINRKHPPGE